MSIEKTDIDNCEDIPTLEIMHSTLTEERNGIDSALKDAATQKEIAVNNYDEAKLAYDDYMHGLDLVAYCEQKIGQLTIANDNQ